ncbi:phosphoserine phosphatase SerB [Methanobacterium spitsbergense]|uniref:phosphoserine phosphatase n=1 Tax=Methanobacterium spitsbergense TaxID=2874285 RepID=A0A8T5UUU8_9EURY|nr:phosphoserine phosphatase SerB [Methanobacterium spitsbergense]MBZ2165706.1 phosphoserine phosphatase SerB [Methanobacterium spitsbergense]
MIKLIAFDLDNVLIDGEAIDEIGKLMDVEAEISEITKKAMEGDLDFETALKERVALLKGASVEDIKDVVSKIPFMEGAEETIAELKKRGYKIATITGSFEIIANRMKDDLGLDYAFSNVLHEKEGKLTGEVSGPLVKGSKAEVLKEIMEMEKIKAEESAAVGDGANDVSMLEEAGLGIAFNAKPVLKEKADVVVEKRDLKEVLEVFNKEEKENETSDETTPEKAEDTAPEETIAETKKEETPLETEEPAKEETPAETEEPAKEETPAETEEPAKEETEKTTKEPSEASKKESPAKKSSPDVKAEVKSEPNPDAGKSFGELLSNKKDLEKRLKVLTKERDDLNENAREFKKVRDELNASIKENLDKALKYRDERDNINKEVRKYKKLRDETNQELKKMEYASGRRDILKIQGEIDKLEKTIETKVLDMRKENELVKKVQDLSKTLSEMKEDEKVQTEAVALKEVSEAHHAKVVEFSDKAQETHESMLEYFKNIDEVRAKADLAHNQFIETRETASAKHEEVKAVLNEIRRKNKGLDKVKAKERNMESEKSKKKNMAEKEIARDIYEKFKEGKKLSTEELRLLQKHNIV